MSRRGAVWRKSRYKLRNTPACRCPRPCILAFFWSPSHPVVLQALEQPRLSEHDVVRALHGESLGFSKANIAGKAVGTVGKVGTDAFACFTCAPDEDDKYRIKEAKGPRACFNTVTL